MATSASNSEKSKSTIVIKRIKRSSHGGHSAAWKIAYADFVTAMMAFFLLMWLLGSTTQGDLKGIADYFDSPLKVAMSGGEGSGDATSVITGGGEDLTRSVGQVKQGDNNTKKRAPERKTDELKKSERIRMERLKARVQSAIAIDPKLSDYHEQIRIEITPDGLRIQIVDDLKRPMFALGSAALQPHMKDILHAIGGVLNDVDSKIALTGHTDSAQYVGGLRGYSNWELSADRANASRRELVIGGMLGEKVVRVVGLADSTLLDATDPKNPINRRIAIMVLDKLAEERLANSGGQLEASTPEAVQDSLTPSETTPDGAPGA
ncbi:MAG TPA: flagellar motor protein MotB, partial [Burkholderiaceae bacterium]|nr:flagellar motor protein MotB [Burkholderiaceae bacterium]